MFIPIHCPYPECDNYQNPECADWYRFFTTYHTKAFGEVTRFRCRSCLRSFSSQTFSINYYAKKTLNTQQIFTQVNAGSGIRKIARSMKVHHNTIRNRIARMARNAIIIHEKVLSQMDFEEDFVVDGFESFCVSQYFPDNYNLLVGERSQFVYRTDYVTLRRKGRMREDQRRRRGELEKIWRANRGQLETSFAQICEWLEQRTRQRQSLLSLYTDEKKEYRRALFKSQVCRDKLHSHQWVHHTTPSTAPRTYWNRLFAANYIDREIRKDMGAHARETVKFNRNVNDAMLRMNLYLFDHNYFKPFRIQYGKKRRLRHAEVAGADRVWIEMELTGFFTRRYFQRPWAPVEGPGKRCLERSWKTPLRGRDTNVKQHLCA